MKKTLTCCKKCNNCYSRDCVRDGSPRGNVPFCLGCKTYNTKFYNLDTIISVGYRVNSICATQFRQWATNVLRNFAIMGYVLDKQRLENGLIFDEEYFENLLEEIRMSERKFYQKITDIYEKKFFDSSL